MPLSAIGGNYNIGVTFRNKEVGDRENQERVRQYTFRNHKVTTETLKEPIEVLKSAALTAVLTFATVYCAVEVALFKFAPKAGIKFENSLKKISNRTKSISSKLKKDKEEGVLHSMKRFIGNVIEFGEEKTRKIYNGISNWGMTKSSDKEEQATKGLSNLIGIGAAITHVYNKCTKDSDGDGVKDIYQTKFG